MHGDLHNFKCVNFMLKVKVSSVLNIRLVTEPERVENSSALHDSHEKGEKTTPCAL